MTGIRARIAVKGIVQGVGFRPFVYRLAREHALTGWVANTSGSVDIEVEGPEGSVRRFVEEFESRIPPQAMITACEVAWLPPHGYAGFEIRHSIAQEGKYQLVSPDIATCPDCIREINAPEDRRHGYPFTNCTNCGPRFTIIRDIPYDRPLTTMAAFKMCGRCRREYDDPMDRRFHAQPNACPECGPRLFLVDSAGRQVSCDDVIAEAASRLRRGEILALKGLGGFHLACEAADQAAVARLRERKKRHGKPLALMMRDLPQVESYCTVSSDEAALMSCAHCPIVLLRRRPGGEADAPALAEGIAPGLDVLGVMLPYTPLHHLLMRQVGRPLVMTSGNLSEEPICKDNDEALARLAGIADHFVLHDRDILSRYDDSVFMVQHARPRPVRRARGYAPHPVSLPFDSRPVLACGAQEKNTFCLTRERFAFVSQHIGDMENEETLEHFAATVDLYRKLFRVDPHGVVCDRHPDYLSTRWAHDFASRHGLPLTAVQHHHAHIASCLADNGETGPVIGVAFDGTGLGDDGTVWGGEFLVADLQTSRRVGHLAPVPLPGGEAAIRKPSRMAVACLHAWLPGRFAHPLALPDMDGGEIALVRRQIDRGLNCPLTTSAGRLFDAASALLGIRGTAAYEAHAAIELEAVARRAQSPDREGAGFVSGRPYEFAVDGRFQSPDREGAGFVSGRPYEFAVDGGEVMIVRCAPLLAALLEDVEAGTPVAEAALRFHRTVAEIMRRVCLDVSAQTGLGRVALSGGVFQNRLLVELAVPLLEESGLKVLLHRHVPCNDGGISLGQAAAAASPGRID